VNKVNEETARAGAPAAKTNPRRYWLFACAIVALGLVVERSAAGHREHENRDIWFVHATDPHLFIPPGEAGREEQQRQNQQALSDLLKYIGSLSESNGPLAFLVLTGDLGVDPCDIRQAGNQPSTATPTPTPTPTPTVQRSAAPAGEAGEAVKQDALSVDDCLKVAPEKRANQITITARVLGQSPVQEIYLIAGNDDIAAESAGDPALKYFNDFIQDVQKELIKNKSRVNLHNLTRCYTSGEAAGSCYADILQSAYRLIGFPSYSFKNSDEKAQAAQFEKFRQLLEDSRKQGMKALVITHSSPMDDPFALAQQRYAHPRATTTALSVPTPTPAAPTATPAPAEPATPAETPTPAGTATPAPKTKKTQTQTDKPPSVTTWKVSEQLVDDWKDEIASESVRGVFAGDLHDAHKEIYRRPYAWSSGSPAAFRKLFLAPPLAVKNQDTSPIQARGFSLVHLQPDRVESRLFWHDSETRAFTPDSEHKHHRARRGFWEPLCERLHATVKGLWELGDADNSKSLDRLAILLIAILATFLTVVAIWKIPPTDDPLPGEPEKPKKTVEPSPFTGNFAGIIIAGLGGLAAASVLKSFDGKPSAGDKEFYIVWFVISFFVLLILSAFLRGLVEALRARFAMIYYPLPRPKWRAFWLSNVWLWLVYRLYEVPLHWLSSLRVPFLAFADTFTNQIQGNNHAITRAFSDKIIDQQRNVVRVANTIRKQLHEVIMERLRECPDQTLSSPPVSGGEERKVRTDDVRVNISVLSLDQKSVFYISQARGSSRQSFVQRSVAWVSVFTGKIRWYKKSYLDDKDRFKEIVLVDNSDKTISDDQSVIYLRSHCQPRSGADYEAWVVFPVPWPRQRGLEESNYVKGAIHISFRNEKHFERIWDFSRTPNKGAAKMDAAIATGNHGNQDLEELGRRLYDEAELMLGDWCENDEVRGTISTAVGVLGEVLRGFNEYIYNYIGKSEQAD
jgi:hypothetical protein